MTEIKQRAKKRFKMNHQTYEYYSLKELEKEKSIQLFQLPYSIRILLESLIRQEDGLAITEEHIDHLANWSNDGENNGEVPFKPSRVILQDFTGVPAVVDLASLRKTIADFGGDPSVINPEVPVDLVIDHFLSKWMLQAKSKRSN